MSSSSGQTHRRTLVARRSRPRSDVRALEPAIAQVRTPLITSVTSSSSDHSPADPDGKKRFRSWVDQCIMIAGDLETTSVALEELLIENEWSRSQLEGELSEIRTLLQEFTNFYLRVVGYCNERNLDTKPHLERRQRFLIRYKSIRGQLLQAVQEKTSPAAGARAKQLDIAGATVKLPDIELPIFDGTSEQWPGWLNVFESLIHTNEALLPIAKLHYLQSSLKGAPRILIAHFAMCDESYQPAFKMVVDRYDDPMNRVARILDNLVKIDTTKEKEQTLPKVLAAYRANATALQVIFQRNPEVDPLSQMLIHSFLSKVDRGTRQDWENEMGRRKKFATFEQFVEYQEGRCSAYERANAGFPPPNTSSKPKGSEKPPAKRPRVFATTATTNNDSKNVTERTPMKCYFCDGEHTVYRCAGFAKLSISERQKQIKAKDWCRRCLSPKCNKKCTSTCRICQKEHNLLIHEEKQTSRATNPQSGKELFSTSIFSHSEGADRAAPSKNSIVRSWIGHVSGVSAETLLATAEIIVSHPESNISMDCKALVDSASQSNLVSYALAKKLRIQPQVSECKLGSIGGHSSQTRGRVTVTLQAKHTGFKIVIPLEIVDEITDLVPSEEFSIQDWALPRAFCLADSTFFRPSKIDVLLGLKFFWKILGNKIYRINSDLPCFRSSKIGWLVTDNRDWEESPQSFQKRIFSILSHDKLAETIQKFWSITEMDSRTSTIEESECETSFLETATRTLKGGEGYFTVYLPFKIKPNRLGQSRLTALKHFFSLERRFSKNSRLKSEYVAGMQDFIDTGHMHEVMETPGTNDEVAYYIPHHAVWKETSTSTKLRTVVNASMPTSTGLSLNHCLMVGPVIQSDLLTVLMRFRVHTFVFSADIVKMYRQIRLHHEHTRFQRIFWRADPDQELKVYEINRLAFGTASAPFLATRCLKALADLDGKLFPEAQMALSHDFYMDDVLTGSDNLESTLRIQEQLRDILLRGGFTLSKWCSNSSEILENIPENQRETSFPFSLEKDDKVIKSLGLLWSATNDTYQVRVNVEGFAASRCKRHILSVIASIFDPLGFLAPVTITAKIIMQKLWLANSSSKKSCVIEHWDEETPSELWEMWLQFASRLNELNEISIPRHIFGQCLGYERLELHGFADASEKAYGAVVYIRAISQTQISSNLIYAKSRVAPVKTSTIPRLELCAATLLTEIIEKVVLSLKSLISFQIVRLWSDSQIVLHWLSASPGKWLPFVANRVQKVQNSQVKAVWDYVPSKQNPADLVSRGVNPTVLKDSSLWWHGPEWLITTTPFDRKTNFVISNHVNDLELRKSKRSLSFATFFRSSIFLTTTNLWKLTRIVAWVSRFLINSHSLGPVFLGPLQMLEVREATKTLVRVAQRETFFSEIKDLKISETVSNSSALKSLYPFLDNDGLIRVGGRLLNADISFSHRHPWVLHPKHPLTEMVIRHHHELHGHIGPQLLKSILRTQFWIPNITRTIRRCTRKCVKCLRFKAEAASQAMAALPKSRVSPARPFFTTGVDYAGPFLTLGKGGRHKVTTKGYISVFVCFITKAIHLEFVSDLTTQSFLAAFSRFSSRRGVPNEVWSDNGTNFVGAKNLMKKEMVEFLQSNTEAITNHAQRIGCQWNFIPPHAPHFGGLWEAGVKSVKSQLKYVLSKNPFTFEQWATVLAQIEACLNSRPLTPESDDPSEIGALTPGHFLIGGPIIALPAPDLTQVPQNRLKHWELVLAQVQKFWKRWRLEYLNTLQQRTKWRTKKDDIKINEIVILKEDNVPPTYWPLGRVIEIFPGKDKLVRVANIKTESGVFKRPITKIIPLHVHNECGNLPN